VEVFVEEPASDCAAVPEPPSPELDPEPLAAPAVELESLPSAGFELFGLLVAARSFFAQPEPLKRIAGVLKPFFREPSAPQLGQNRGVGSLIPWMTSVRWPHVEQS
jgi:hypothetical protein